MNEQRSKTNRESEQLRSYVRQARKGKGLGRKSLAAIIAVTALVTVGGFLAAAQTGLFSSSSIPFQGVSNYQTSASSDANFPTAPTIALSTTYSAASSCTSSASAFPGSGGNPVRIYLAADNAITCTAGDFALFVVLNSISTALTAETATITISTSWETGSGTMETNQLASAQLTVASGVPSQTQISLWVDFGAGQPTSISSFAVSIN
jgi:hypothetical protein